ncbi:starch synthase 3 chloroplastic/amyloplastic isoform X1 [Prunus yedoensis var. nudiflora]|uniref:starch synthase n=1 Tax=Prunus yedoensis var. nudiflora TaxID=2094558 RepID=A0A314ZA54_PRUYE|nr:starch synthase 3 chloroplastic/amyloplastic isoform X1 [Prunus yedoensis var. nudiflora]
MIGLAPVAWLYKDHYMHYGLSKARVVFTIHNLEFGEHFIGKAVEYSDKTTTVSDTYAKEVAGNPAIAPHLYKFHGIINEIDQDIWDPYNDKFILGHIRMLKMEHMLISVLDFKLATTMFVTFDPYYSEYNCV